MTAVMIGVDPAKRLRAMAVLDVLGAGCGLRVGEVLGLTFGSIDVDRALLHVSV